MVKGHRGGYDLAKILYERLGQARDSVKRKYLVEVIEGNTDAIVKSEVGGDCEGDGGSLALAGFVFDPFLSYEDGYGAYRFGSVARLEIDKRK